MSPAVSIIIPCYNTGYLLAEAIQSVVCQTFTDLEIIVVDDGSTDNTREVVEAMDDPRVRYHYQSNQGAAVARNAALELARGEFIAFLDADDLFMPDKLDLQVAALRQAPDLGLVAGGYIEIDGAGRVTRELRLWESNRGLALKDWVFGCRFPVHSALVRRQWVERVGGFDSTVRYCEDWDLWLRLARAGCRMGWTPACVCAYRFHDTNMSWDASATKHADLLVVNRVFCWPGLPPEDAGLRRRALARAWARGAWHEYGAGEVESGRASLSRAVELAPELAGPQSELLIDLMVEWAMNPLTGDPITFVTAVSDHLPDELASIGQAKRRILSRVWAAQSHLAYERRQMGGVRRAVIQAVLAWPKCIRDRGLVSIWLESVLGSSVVGVLRRRGRRSERTDIDLQVPLRRKDARETSARGTLEQSMSEADGQIPPQ